MKVRIQFFLLYVAGVGMALIFWFLESQGKIEVLYRERLPQREGNLLLISNHPSLLEPFLIPHLFLRDYWFNFKFAPWTVADKKNFWDPWYFWILRPRLIPVERSRIDKYSEVKKPLSRISEILKENGIVILFPEGGRTRKGRMNGEQFSFSKKGKRIREIKPGVKWIALRNPTTRIVPIWIEGVELLVKRRNLFLKIGRFRIPKLWKIEKITIKIGHPFKGTKEEEITEKVSQSLLKLADQ